MLNDFIRYIQLGTIWREFEYAYKDITPDQTKSYIFNIYG